MSPQILESLITRSTGKPFKVESIEPTGQASRWRTFAIANARTGNPKRIFAKAGEADCLRNFAAERDGLNCLSTATSPLRVPQVVACETLDEQAVLLLEWIDLMPLDATSAAMLGEGLAMLHRSTTEKFGLASDNFIGATPQRNAPDANWVRFWQMNRLMPQLELAAKHRYPSRMIDRGERLASDCGAFFRDYQPVPSLLHGDLWSGNVAADETGRPVIFDPAVYYGDREADVAMTELFGRQPADFYTAYDNAWPRDVGYAVRREFYNLYHVLNHANLFAGDYVRQSERMIEALLAEL